MGELKKVPLFFMDVQAIPDEDVDEWAVQMAEYVSRVTGLPLEKDSKDTEGQTQAQSADQPDPLTEDQIGK